MPILDLPHCTLQEIITDESVKKPESKAASLDMVEQAVEDLENLCSSPDVSDLQDRLRASPQEFEKDDDSNGHIDFITAASVSVVYVAESSKVPVGLSPGSLLREVKMAVCEGGHTVSCMQMTL